MVNIPLKWLETNCQNKIVCIRMKVTHILSGCQDGRVVKALDSIAATICQTCSPAARVGAQLYALSEQLADWQRLAECPPCSVWSCLGSGSPTLAGSPKECSSPQVWAWIRIPLLTDLFFFFCSASLYFHSILCTVNLFPTFLSVAPPFLLLLAGSYSLQR